MFKKLAIIALLMILAVVGFAQEATPEATPDAEATAELTPEATETVEDELCPTLVENAIQITQTNCDATDTNEACYGYIFIDAELRGGDAEFVAPGDIEQVINIQSLQLSPMDTASGQWGVIVLAVEANANPLDEAATSDNTEAPENDDVQIVLYGDTQLSDASQFVEVTAIGNVNIREQPRTNAGIIASMTTGESLIANGRLPDNTWFRVRIVSEADIGIGWIAAEFLEAGFDPDTLPVITAEEAELPPEDLAAQYGPMQAFIFESGENDAPCSEAPNSGMLIQTPEGVASVTIWLDEVVIQLDGTGVISAQADGDLTVGVIDGTAQVEANGLTSTAVAGQAVDVPLDSDLGADGTPSAPRDITDDEVQGVPTTLLDDPVTIPTANSAPIIAPASAGFQWQFSYNTPPPYICSDGSEVILQSAGINPLISAEADAIVISGFRFPQVTDGVYSASYLDNNGNVIQDTIQVISSDRIIGDRTIDLSNPICSLTVSFTIQLVAQ